eukprot:2536550-Pyramimonas_sp.AAC.1
MYNVGWVTARDALAEVLRRHGNRSLSSSGKRLRGGPVSVGGRSCQFSYIQFFGETWWTAARGDWVQFLEVWKQLLTHYSKTKVYTFFVVSWKVSPNGPRGSPEAQKEVDPEAADIATNPLHPKHDPKESAKLALRYAMIQERATVWDISSEGSAVEFKGDSLLICSWLHGRWRC